MFLLAGFIIKSPRASRRIRRMLAGLKVHKVHKGFPEHSEIQIQEKKAFITSICQKKCAKLFQDTTLS